jgi:hypothetical protein
MMDAGHGASDVTLCGKLCCASACTEDGEGLRPTLGGMFRVFECCLDVFKCHFGFGSSPLELLGVCSTGRLQGSSYNGI